MYNLFTCGELHTLDFTSKDFSNTDELLNNSEDFVLLNNNSKKTRSSGEKKGEFKIKSNARIIKLDTNNISKDTFHTIFENPEDVKNIFEVSENTNELKISERMEKIIKASKADGIYITERMADKLKEHFPQNKEQIDSYKNNVLLTNKSLVVNKNDYVKEKIDRACTVGKEAKELYTMCHEHREPLNAIVWDKHLHGLDFKTDWYGKIIQVTNNRTGSDITKFCRNFIEETEKELNQLFEEVKKEYPEIEHVDLWINKNLDPEGLNELRLASSEQIDKDRILTMPFVIEITPMKAIKTYFALKNSNFIPEKEKGEIHLKDVVKSIFYHEVGHAVNNDYFVAQQAFDKYTTKDEDLPDIRYVKKENIGKLYNSWLKKERDATDFALKSMPGNKAAMYTLGAFFSTYHTNKLRAVFDSYEGDKIDINGKNVTVI